MIEWESAAWIWLSGLLFAVSHSLTASRRCKQFAYHLGLREPRYRLTYSVVSLLTTSAWLFFAHQLPDAPLYDADGLLQGVLVAMQILGLIVVFAAFQPIDGLVFLGLRKAKEGCDPFIVDGVYRWMRHPMYAGAMLVLLAMPEQSWNGLHIALVICVYFIIGSRFEESRMLAEHPDYADYRNQAPAFIPALRARPFSD
jgi:protein-S-isoprenylcysteine O-methyltransferase Ste14